MAVSEISEVYVDQPLIFTVSDRSVRGRIVRLGDVKDTILAARDYPPLIAGLLSEALVLTSLLGSIMKQDESQVTLQAQSDDGLVSLLVCDCKAGALRGYAQYDESRLVRLAGASAGLAELFGSGFLAITFDQADYEGTQGGRYQGIVPLEGEGLAEAAEHYFAQSEQIPTLLRLAVGEEFAGGVLIQYLPDSTSTSAGGAGAGAASEHGDGDKASADWDYIHSLAATLTAAEMCDGSLSLDTLLWRLFHQDKVRIHQATALYRGCRCSLEHYRRVLQKFPPEQHRDMADEADIIHIDCAFCAKNFALPLAEIR